MFSEVGAVVEVFLPSDRATQRPRGFAFVEFSDAATVPIAIEKLETGDAYGANSNLIKGKSIVAELLASLNMEQGGDIALNLQRLYTYIFNELIDANLNKDVARVQRVIELLKELRDGWKTIPAAGKTAPAPGDSPGSIKRIHVQG